MSHEVSGGRTAQGCLAEEWHRDGRGLWAKRSCRQWGKHAHHDFASWEYNVQPPAAALASSSSVPPAQAEQSDLVAAVTAICRKADRDFERVGGSSRHWVRDCFLPTLNAGGFLVTRQVGANADTLCRHCNEELRLLDGDWCDRETHTICPDTVGKKHEPAALPPAAGIPVEAIREKVELFRSFKRYLDDHAKHEPAAAEQAHVWGRAADELDALLAKVKP